MTDAVTLKANRETYLRSMLARGASPEAVRRAAGYRERDWIVIAPPAVRRDENPPERLPAQPRKGADLIPPIPGKTIPAAEIIQAVCEAFDLEPGALTSDWQTRSVAWPRQAAMALLRKYNATCQASLTSIAHLLARHDHTTIAYGIQTARERLNTCSYFRKQYKAAEKTIRAKAGMKPLRGKHA